MCFHPSEII
ncbi:hypothetical protein VCCP1050_3775, partial [Vibrio cholerae CP1050(23)]